MNPGPRYRVEVTTRAQRQLRKLPAEVSKGLSAVIWALAENPYPPASRRMVNRPDYRIRWRDYRIIYTVHEDCLVVEVVSAGHRREVYQ